MKRLICILMLLYIGCVSVSIVLAQPVAVEFLVRTSDGPGGRAKGDIINMKISPASWGRCECLPGYVIVKVTGVFVPSISQFHIRHGKLIENDVSATPEMVRSRFRFNIGGFSESVDGKITASASEAISNLIDRRVEILAKR